jgi:hypothetical protein
MKYAVTKAYTKTLIYNNKYYAFCVIAIAC